ncbi:hypothetical protein HDU67_001712, partial [Dinochytrium kinnereticum]
MASTSGDGVSQRREVKRDEDEVSRNLLLVSIPLNQTVGSAEIIGLPPEKEPIDGTQNLPSLPKKAVSNNSVTTKPLMDEALASRSQSNPVNSFEGPKPVVESVQFTPNDSGTSGSGNAEIGGKDSENGPPRMAVAEEKSVKGLETQRQAEQHQRSDGRLNNSDRGPLNEAGEGAKHREASATLRQTELQRRSNTRIDTAGGTISKKSAVVPQDSSKEGTKNENSKTPNESDRLEIREGGFRPSENKNVNSDSSTTLSLKRSVVLGNEHSSEKMRPSTTATVAKNTEIILQDTDKSISRSQKVEGEATGNGLQTDGEEDQKDVKFQKAVSTPPSLRNSIRRAPSRAKSDQKTEEAPLEAKETNDLKRVEERKIESVRISGLQDFERTGGNDSNEDEFGSPFSQPQPALAHGATREPSFEIARKGLSSRTGVKDEIRGASERDLPTSEREKSRQASTEPTLSLDIGTTEKAMTLPDKSVAPTSNRRTAISETATTATNVKSTEGTGTDSPPSQPGRASLTTAGAKEIRGSVDNKAIAQGTKLPKLLGRRVSITPNNEAKLKLAALDSLNYIEPESEKKPPTVGDKTYLKNTSTIKSATQPESADTTKKTSKLKSSAPKTSSTLPKPGETPKEVANRLKSQGKDKPTTSRLRSSTEIPTTSSSSETDQNSSQSSDGDSAKGIKFRSRSVTIKSPPTSSETEESSGVLSEPLPAPLRSRSSSVKPNVAGKQLDSRAKQQSLGNVEKVEKTAASTKTAPRKVQKSSKPPPTRGSILAAVPGSEAESSSESPSDYTRRPIRRRSQTASKSSSQEALAEEVVGSSSAYPNKITVKKSKLKAIDSPPKPPKKALTSVAKKETEKETTKLKANENEAEGSETSSGSEPASSSSGETSDAPVSKPANAGALIDTAKKAASNASITSSRSKTAAPQNSRSRSLNKAPAKDAAPSRSKSVPPSTKSGKPNTQTGGMGLQTGKNVAKGLGATKAILKPSNPKDIKKKEDLSGKTPSAAAELIPGVESVPLADVVKDESMTPIVLSDSSYNESDKPSDTELSSDDHIPSQKRSGSAIVPAEPTKDANKTQIEESDDISLALIKEGPTASSKTISRSTVFGSDEFLTLISKEKTHVKTEESLVQEKHVESSKQQTSTGENRSRKMEIKPVLLKRRSSTSLPPTSISSRRPSLTLGRTRVASALPKSKVEVVATTDSPPSKPGLVEVIKNTASDDEGGSKEPMRNLGKERTSTAPVKSLESINKPSKRAKTSPGKQSIVTGSIAKLKSTSDSSIRQGILKSTEENQATKSEVKAEAPEETNNTIKTPGQVSKETSEAKTVANLQEDIKPLKDVKEQQEKEVIETSTTPSKVEQSGPPLVHEEMLLSASSINDGKEYRVKGDFLLRLLRHFPGYTRRRAYSADALPRSEKINKRKRGIKPSRHQNNMRNNYRGRLADFRQPPDNGFRLMAENYRQGIRNIGVALLIRIRITTVVRVTIVILRVMEEDGGGDIVDSVPYEFYGSSTSSISDNELGKSYERRQPQYDTHLRDYNSFAEYESETNTKVKRYDDYSSRYSPHDQISPEIYDSTDFGNFLYSDRALDEKEYRSDCRGYYSDTHRMEPEEAWISTDSFETIDTFDGGKD